MRSLLLSITLLTFGAVHAQLRITEVITKNDQIMADFEGDYTDMIEITNGGDRSIKLSSFFITDNPEKPHKWQLPEFNLLSGQVIVIFASGKDTMHSEYHTNFKLQQSKYETLVICDSFQNIIDSVSLPCIPENHSYAKIGSAFYLDSLPTPGTSNTSSHIYTVTPDELVWSHEAGLYESAIQLTVNSSEGHEVKISTNGDYPDDSQHGFHGALNIDQSTISPLSMIPTSENWHAPIGSVLKGTVVAAQTFNHDCPLSSREKRTFIVTPDATTRYPAVVSLSFKADDMFGDYGLYVPGITGQNSVKKGKDWERDAYLEYFDMAGDLKISTPVGVRINGKSSRVKPHKSLRVYFRDEYGIDSMQNFTWNDRPDSLFVRRFLLRARYSYGKKSLVRDHVLSKALEGTDMDYQASDPTVVFMNGEYWGIHFVKERHDIDYISRKHGVSRDKINLMETGGELSKGSNASYMELINLARNRDLSQQENYEEVIEKIDLQNFVDYMVINMYFENTDWPDNNVKMWNSDEEHPKFRWLLYDGDYMFYPSHENLFEKLSMDKHEADIDHILFASLMQNKRFQELVKLRALKLLDDIFNPDRMLKIIDDLEAELTPFIPEQIKRWNNPSSMMEWHQDLDQMRFFFQNKPQSFLSDLESVMDMNFTVYPNPSRDLLNLPEEFSNQNIIYEVYSHTGQKMKNGAYTGNLPLDISDLSNGVYTLRILIEGKTMYSKFVKV